MRRNTISETNRSNKWEKKIEDVVRNENEKWKKKKQPKSNYAK